MPPKKTSNPLAAEAKRAKNQRRRANKQAKKRVGGATISGHGAYSLKEVANAAITPFTYSQPGTSVVNKGARFLGSALGDATGIPGAGRVLGNAASWFASKVLGMGDYTMPNRYSVTSNSLMGTPGFHTNAVPSFSGDGAVTRVIHQEFISDITSSVQFVNNNYLINPGNPVLFRWLSRIAENFEEFEFKGLVFVFKTMSATAVGSTNTGLGALMMATDYDVVDENYVDKVSMEISDFSVSGAPCASYLHPVECDKKQNVLGRMFVNSAVTKNQYPDDPRFSCHGNFQIATVGMQAASNIGELWVAYDVELRKPQLPPPPSSILSDHQQLSFVPGGTPGTGTVSMNRINSQPSFLTPLTASVPVFNPTYGYVDFTYTYSGPPVRLLVSSSMHSAVLPAAGHGWCAGNRFLCVPGNGGTFAHISSGTAAGVPNLDANNYSAGTQDLDSGTAGYAEMNSTAILDLPDGGTFYLRYGVITTAVGPTTYGAMVGDIFVTQINASLTATAICDQRAKNLVSNVDKLSSELEALRKLVAEMQQTSSSSSSTPGVSAVAGVPTPTTPMTARWFSDRPKYQT